MINPDILLALSPVLAALAIYLLHRWRAPGHALPFPPGPKPLPVVGNIFDVPMAREYLTYDRWRKEYGDVVHVNALGTHIVILNSLEAAKELLDGRSAIYSDRPIITMLHDSRLVHSQRTFVFTPYSPPWRRQRRLFQRYLGPAQSRSYFGVQTSSARALLRNTLNAPGEIVAHLRHAAAETILQIAYGYTIQPTNDPLVDLIERGLAVFVQAALPSRFLVNVIPWLKYVPPWFPGAGFKRLALEGKRIESTIVETTYNGVRQNLSQGTALPSVMANALGDPSTTEEVVADIKAVTLSIYGAGSDTTVSSIHSCILALVLSPAIQSRAHAELDSVIGPPTSPTFRLPNFSDRSDLPYLNAIVTETLRWLPATPLAVPHSNTEEDVYRGWKIPKNTIVIANAWGLLHDENEYPDPYVFRPERYLGEKPAAHPATRGCFGFGRRECPGKYLAETSLWIQIASLLAVFDFSSAKDAKGNDIDVSYACEPCIGLISHPQQFPCRITPRSKEAEMRIHEIQQELE